MQITDEMIEAALRGWCGYGPDADLSKYQQAPETKDAWRRALDAALGQFMLQYGDNVDNVELQEAEQIWFNRSAACIEDLAVALNYMIQTQEVWEEDVSKIIQRPPNIFNRAIDCARATLERWGLK